MTLAQFQEFLCSRGQKKYSAEQVFQWIYKFYEFSPEKWSNVSKSVRELVQQELSLALPQIVWNGESRDGTRKFLLAMEDKKTIESVAIAAKNNRLTLCLSSQVGCAIGCTFCHTGTMGLTRHLGIGEIVGQYLAVSRWLLDHASGGQATRLTNIVYMGQGEPLHNFENVKMATEIFLEEKGIGLGQRKITLSTSGLVPQIEKLGQFPPVNIAISLHAAHDKVRSELMPINKAYDLERLFRAIKTIPLKAHRYITYEYILIANLNDGQTDIDGLCRLLDRDISKINLIPFNEYPQSQFKKPEAQKIKWFQEELMQRGYICTVRTTKGEDILAACGQLKSELDKSNLWAEDGPRA